MDLEILNTVALELTKMTGVTSKDDISKTYKYFLEFLAKENEVFGTKFVDDIHE